MCWQAILVNYRSAALMVEAVRSLADSSLAGGRIDVVDNSTCASEAALLRSQLPAACLLHVAERNLGFAAACNLAFAQADSEFVLLLNPDARLQPGALTLLVDFLRTNPRAAAVGPRVFWDEGRQFLMPLSTFPSPGWYVRHCLGGLVPGWQRLARRRFRQEAIGAWQAREPFAVAALSGGHVLLRRQAVLAAGGLFDPAFFMYWEDSDLMRRLRATGGTLHVQPKAEAVHLYSHSPAKDALIGTGWTVYRDKYFAAWPWRWLAHGHGRGPWGRALPVLRDAPWTPTGVTLPVPAQWPSWLLELGPVADFVPAIGHLGTGRNCTIPASLLRHFAGCTVYFRLTAADGGLRDAQHFRVQVAA